MRRYLASETGSSCRVITSFDGKRLIWRRPVISMAKELGDKDSPGQVERGLCYDCHREDRALLRVGGSWY